MFSKGRMTSNRACAADVSLPSTTGTLDLFADNYIRRPDSAHTFRTQRSPDYTAEMDNQSKPHTIQPNPELPPPPRGIPGVPAPTPFSRRNSPANLGGSACISEIVPAISSARQFGGRSGMIRQPQCRNWLHFYRITCRLSKIGRKKVYIAPALTCLYASLSEADVLSAGAASGRLLRSCCRDRATGDHVMPRRTTCAC